MARKKGELPAYRLHKMSGRGYVYLDGKQHLLPGAFRSEESLVAYRRTVAEWASGQGRRVAQAGATLTVAQLADDYLAHARTYYRRKDGSPTHEVENIEHALAPLRALYGTLPVAEFDLARLKVVRDEMIHPTATLDVAPRRALARTTINGRIARVVRMFAWGAEELVVPATVYGCLRALRRLKKGRCEAREPEPRRPVPEKDMRATLPHLTPTLQGLVLFMWHTAARVGEAVQLRSRDVDMSGEVWIFQPAQHKLLHRDRPRLIAIGPEAQEALRLFVKLDREALWFTPDQTLAEASQARRAARKTPLWPSHMARYAREAASRAPREVLDHFEVRAVARAIRRAAVRAGVAPWSPHQLRHAALSRIRRERGLEAAAAIAGHSAVGMTDHYSWEAQKAKALEVAKEVG